MHLKYRLQTIKNFIAFAFYPAATSEDEEAEETALFEGEEAGKQFLEEELEEDEETFKERNRRMTEEITIYVLPSAICFWEGCKQKIYSCKMIVLTVIMNRT